jgi:hypothetical protein
MSDFGYFPISSGLSFAEVSQIHFICCLKVASTDFLSNLPNSFKMKFSLFIVWILVVLSTPYALPASSLSLRATHKNGTLPDRNDNNELVEIAVNSWRRDTGVVSNFLNKGQSFTDNQTFKNQAFVAYSAEIDELSHKKVIDQYFSENQNIRKANATLSGSFQLVVDQLFRMAIQGRQAIDGIELINKDRCVNVLPSIDIYFRESAAGSQVKTAIRPDTCSNITSEV